MEPKLFQRCETKGDADACKASHIKHAGPAKVDLLTYCMPIFFVHFSQEFDEVGENFSVQCITLIAVIGQLNRSDLGARKF